jgi:hypothetical protein
MATCEKAMSEEVAIRAVDVIGDASADSDFDWREKKPVCFRFKY